MGGVEQAAIKFFETFKKKKQPLRPLLEFKIVLVSCSSGKGENSMVRQFARARFSQLLKVAQTLGEFTLDVKFMAPDEIISIRPGIEHSYYIAKDHDPSSNCFDFKKFEIKTVGNGKIQGTTQWTREIVMEEQEDNEDNGDGDGRMIDQTTKKIKGTEDLCKYYVRAFREFCITDDT